MIIFRLAVAITLFGHGIGHVVGFLGSWTQLRPFPEPAFNESPWIFSEGVFIQSTIGKVFGIFWLLSMGAFFAASIGLIANQAWWSTTTVIASILSLLAVVPWWNSFTPGIMSKKSAVLVDVLALVVLLGPWRDVVLARLGSG